MTLSAECLTVTARTLTCHDFNFKQTFPTLQATVSVREQAIKNTVTAKLSKHVLKGCHFQLFVCVAFLMPGKEGDRCHQGMGVVMEREKIKLATAGCGCKCLTHRLPLKFLKPALAPPLDYYTNKTTQIFA